MNFERALFVACALASACAQPSAAPLAPVPDNSAAPVASPAATPVASASAPAASAAAPQATFDSIVAAPDRSEQDRALDAGRKPAELLAFIGVKPGMRVAELGAGGGYTAELLARAVGPTGTVYGLDRKSVV